MRIYFLATNTTLPAISFEYFKWADNLYYSIAIFLGASNAFVYPSVISLGAFVRAKTFSLISIRGNKRIAAFLTNSIPFTLTFLHIIGKGVLSGTYLGTFITTNMLACIFWNKDFSTYNTWAFE
jgi:hypothetical protein